MLRSRASLTITIVIALQLAACSSDDAGTSGGTSTPTTLRFTSDADFETGEDTGEPNLFATPDGQLLMSWLERTETGHTLKIAARRDGVWSSAKTAYTSDSMFANWADFPSVAATTDGKWIVHWLERVEGGTYAYHARMSESTDDGETWTQPVTIHEDISPTEHGFLAMVPDAEGSMDMIWLDGRETGGPVRGPMQIWGTTVDRHGNRISEHLVDNQVCDCCNTALVRAASGLVAAYRDRTDEEIRDIAVRYKDNGVWSDPIHVGNDNWHIAGCPVNGPALAATGDTVAIAWFTSPERQSRVQVAYSFDGARSFGEAIRVDDGNPLGRVDIELLPGNLALVTWLERVGEEAEIRVRLVPSHGEPHAAQTLVQTTQARQGGFPRSARIGDKIFFAHRAVNGGVGKVRVLVASID